MPDNLLVCIGDGDNIGDTIEFYLLSGNLEEASQFSYQVKTAIADMAKLVHDEIEASVISSLHKKFGKNVIFDVTSVTKVYIGDIFACCLLENVNELCPFELLIVPNYSKPWKILIHDLEENKQYRHLNLVETPIFKESGKAILIRTTPLLISIIGTAVFITLTLAATFLLGNNSIIIQGISSVGTALGIISFVLIYFPIRPN